MNVDTQLYGSNYNFTGPAGMKSWQSEPRAWTNSPPKAFCRELLRPLLLGAQPS